MGHFVELSILIALAAGISIIMRSLRQPLIIGHIITGLIAGTFFSGLIDNVETLRLFSEIGIAILLFLVGLHLNPKTVKKFGKVSIITGVVQVLFTSLVGFALCKALGIETVESIYISIGLAFSSTIIIMKLISDRGDLDSLYGRISIGFLLVQDLFAILILFMLPFIASGDFSALDILFLFGKGTILMATIYLISTKIMPRLNDFLAKSSELLFIFTIAWGLGISSLFLTTGFGIESGALIAGISLAGMPVRREITARLTPLRDFFIIMFFILLGSQMEFSRVTDYLPEALSLSALVLIGNPLILMSIMGILGYTKKTSLQTGFTVAQISEFSLILMALGLNLGHVSSDSVMMVTLVGLITIFGSTYLIMYSDKIYKTLEPFLGIFERKKTKPIGRKQKEVEVIIFGAGKISQEFISHIKREKLGHLIVDHNPKTISSLDRKKFKTLLYEAQDIHLLDNIPFNEAKLVMIMIDDLEASISVCQKAREVNPEIIVVALATKNNITHELYDEDIDYVIEPNFLANQHLLDIFVKHGFERKKYEKSRSNHLDMISTKKRRSS